MEALVLLLLPCNAFVDSPLEFRAPIMLNNRNLIGVLWTMFSSSDEMSITEIFPFIFGDFPILLFEAAQAEFRCGPP